MQAEMEKLIEYGCYVKRDRFGRRIKNRKTLADRVEKLEADVAELQKAVFKR